MNDAQAIFDASLAALGAHTAVAAIQTISAIAECTCPRGDYTTEIQSARGGSVSFKQTWSNRNPVAIVINAHGAWATDTVTGETDTLDAKTVSMIRGHEFQMIPLTLSERFTEICADGKTEFDGKECFAIQARDDINLPCTLYFDGESLCWLGALLTNSQRVDETVRVVVNAWREVADVCLPARVTATDSSGDYVLDFQQLAVNATADHIFEPRLAVEA